MSRFHRPVVVDPVDPLSIPALDREPSIGEPDQ